MIPLFHYSNRTTLRLSTGCERSELSSWKGSINIPNCLEFLLFALFLKSSDQIFMNDACNQGLIGHSFFHRLYFESPQIVWRYAYIHPLAFFKRCFGCFFCLNNLLFQIISWNPPFGFNGFHQFQFFLIMKFHFSSFLRYILVYFRLGKMVLRKITSSSSTYGTM